MKALVKLLTQRIRTVTKRIISELWTKFSHKSKVIDMRGYVLFIRNSWFIWCYIHLAQIRCKFDYINKVSVSWTTSRVVALLSLCTLWIFKIHGICRFELHQAYLRKSRTYPISIINILLTYCQHLVCYEIVKQFIDRSAVFLASIL